ncbi:hypothetical protein BCR39DRAFT_525267 [Naematelia encephala]|uniref:Uncharacterized protein n=1 Tax=Naematelia encephala TaxID=71784 RepID=A0A1Y2BAC9_9TREE|nr:hypothetical protein BCR39DRAFT_525267 [Naematelia encephala]
MQLDVFRLIYCGLKLKITSFFCFLWSWSCLPEPHQDVPFTFVSALSLIVGIISFHDGDARHGISRLGNIDVLA